MYIILLDFLNIVFEQIIILLCNIIYNMLSIFVNSNLSSNKIINTLGNQVTLNLNPGVSLDDKKNINCVY